MRSCNRSVNLTVPSATRLARTCPVKALVSDPMRSTVCRSGDLPDPSEISPKPGSLAAVREAAVAIECETEMRSQRSDGRVVLRIRIGIGCGNDDDPELVAILATRWQHRCSQCIALPVAQREEKRHLSLYMGLEADVALDRVGSLRTPGLDCLLPLAAKILLDRMAHEARLMHGSTFHLDTEPGLTLRRVAYVLHFARPAIPQF